MTEGIRQVSSPLICCASRTQPSAAGQRGRRIRRCGRPGDQPAACAPRGGVRAGRPGGGVFASARRSAARRWPGSSTGVPAERCWRAPAVLSSLGSCCCRWGGEHGGGRGLRRACRAWPPRRWSRACCAVAGAGRGAAAGRGAGPGRRQPGADLHRGPCWSPGPTRVGGPGRLALGGRALGVVGTCAFLLARRRMPKDAWGGRGSCEPHWLGPCAAGGWAVARRADGQRVALGAMTLSRSRTADGRAAAGQSIPGGAGCCCR